MIIKSCLNRSILNQALDLGPGIDVLELLEEDIGEAVLSEEVATLIGDEGAV